MTIFVPQCRDLSKDVQDELLAHIELLEQFGPLLASPRAEYSERLTSLKYEE
jgi:hypothetical protein